VVLNVVLSIVLSIVNAIAIKNQMNFNIILLTSLFTGMLLAGDYFIKLATVSPNPIKFLLLAAALWVTSIGGWYYVVSREF
jgi:hypothetical protein